MFRSMVAFLVLLGAVAIIALPLGYEEQARGYNDVEVYKNDTIWKCDMINCPLDAYRCHVTKTVINGTVLQRKNACYNKSNLTLVEKTTTKAINGTGYETLELEMLSNGMVSSSSGAGSQNSAIYKEVGIAFGDLNYRGQLQQVMDVNKIINSFMAKMFM